MIGNNLRFVRRDLEDCSSEAINERRYRRLKGKTLKQILLHRFLNQYGYDKGAITASAIIDEIDGVLAKHYAFTDEELDFIVNYDIKYRMGRDAGEEECGATC
jgi:hypothetical protein